MKVADEAGKRLVSSRCHSYPIGKKTALVRGGNGRQRETGA